VKKNQRKYRRTWMNIWVVFRVEYGSNIVFGWVVKSVFVFPTSGSGQQKVPEDYMMFVYP
jgi:hypothetical protein